MKTNPFSESWKSKTDGRMLRGLEPTNVETKVANTNPHFEPSNFGVKDRVPSYSGYPPEVKIKLNLECIIDL